jgi:hypothetical protein
MVHFLGAVVMPRTPSKAPRIPGKAVGMINDMKELKTFLEGDYIRFGHTEDEEVIALKKTTIDDVVATRDYGGSNDGLQTALGVLSLR